jgi:phage tail protein X
VVSAQCSSVWATLVAVIEEVFATAADGLAASCQAHSTTTAALHCPTAVALPGRGRPFCKS